jgi:hypothetical protein
MGERSNTQLDYKYPGTRSHALRGERTPGRSAARTDQDWRTRAAERPYVRSHAQRGNEDDERPSSGKGGDQAQGVRLWSRCCHENLKNATRTRSHALRGNARLAALRHE